MNTFNINALIERHGLDTKKVAVELFPENKYPMIALSRVISGEALLNTEQVSKLSFLTGIPINQLFEQGEWVNLPRKANDNTMAFENGEYRAELNRDTWETKIFHKNSIFHESVITNGATLPLSVYFAELDKLILNHINNGKH